jgi:hypothetical protein
MWEMHPSADEFLFLVSGAVCLILQEETSDRNVELGAGQATIVPRGYGTGYSCVAPAIYCSSTVAPGCSIVLSN